MDPMQRQSVMLMIMPKVLEEHSLLQTNIMDLKRFHTEQITLHGKTQKQIVQKLVTTVIYISDLQEIHIN